MTARIAVALLCGACGGGGDTRATDAAAADTASGICDATTPWATAPPLPRGATQETATVALAGKVYVLGGFDADAQVLDTVQVLDVASCSWSLGPPLPKRVHHANATVVGETIYVTGAMQSLAFTAIGDTWAWAPASEPAWQVRAAMPAGSERGSAVTGVVDGRIHVVGGLRGGSVADHHVYDPVADSWGVRPALPASRDHGCGAAIAGALLVVGGRGGAINDISPTVYAYADGAWLERAPMPTARGGTACGVVGDRLVVVGGEGNPDDPSGVFSQAEAYDAARDTWTSLAAMPTPRHGMGAAGWEGKLYVPGGATVQGFGAVATHEVLTP